MADNSSVPVASGNETFANDDIGGVKYPRSKVTWGPDGTANDADVASGMSLPVQIRSATGLIPIGDPTDDKSAATDTTSVSLISLVKQLSAYLGTLAGAVGSSKVATKSASGDFADGAIATLGAMADAKSAATDTTAISLMQVAKQISASIQALVTGTVIAAGTALIGRVSSSPETSTIYNGTTALTPKFAKISASSSGANTIVAAVSGKKIRVLAWDTVPNAAVNFKWQSHVTPTDLTGLYYMAGQGNGVARSFNPAGYFETVAGEALDLNLSGAVAVGGCLTYVEV